MKSFPRDMQFPKSGLQHTKAAVLDKDPVSSPLGQVQTLIASIEVSMGMLRAAARSGESYAPVSALMRMIESRDFPAANRRF